MKITKVRPDQTILVARIISKSNRDVARQFNFTLENNPRHPSFCTEAWVLSDINRGVGYFLYKSEGTFMGCVAFEHPQAEIAYLNRLSVLPEFRDRGIGASLVRYVVDYAKAKNIALISIGIIATHSALKAWYENLGFIEIETRSFEHLPFDVTYMHFKL